MFPGGTPKYITAERKVALARKELALAELELERVNLVTERWNLLKVDPKPDDKLQELDRQILENKQKTDLYAS